MIQFNKTTDLLMTLFSRRLALVIFSVAISNVVLGGGKEHTTAHYSQATAHAVDYTENVAAGKVYVTNNADAIPSADDYDAEVISESTSCGAREGLWGTGLGAVQKTAEDDIHKYYYYAITTEDFLWGGWYTGTLDANGNLTGEKMVSSAETVAVSSDDPKFGQEDSENDSFLYAIQAQSTSSNSPTPLVLYAKWLLPQVLSVTPDENKQLPPYTNPADIGHDTNGQKTENIVFSVKEANSADNFKIYVGSSQQNLAEVTNNNYFNEGLQTFTYPLTYTITGKHNNTETKCVKLESEYGGKGVPSFQTSGVVTFKEDYTPKFETTNGTANILVDPTSEDPFETESGDLKPTQLNYAASTMPKDGKNGATWTVNKVAVEGRVDDYDCFSVKSIINGNDPIDPIVEFTLPALAEGELYKKEYKVKIELTCTYKDIEETIVHPKDINNESSTQDVKKVIEITASLSSAILFNEASETTLELQDPIIHIADDDVQHSKDAIDEQTKFKTNLEINNLLKTLQVKNNNNWIEWVQDDEKVWYTLDKVGKKATVRICPEKLPGNYEYRLILTEDTEEEDKATATWNIKFRVELKKPVLRASASSDGGAILSWDPIDGADGYRIEYSEGSTIGTSPMTQDVPSGTSCVLSGLEEEKVYALRVVALYNADHNFDKPSDIITFIPNTYQTIIKYDTQHGFMTGTEHTGGSHPEDGTFPYMTKRAIDLSAAFDHNKHVKFSRLYIFEVTHGKEDNSYDEVTKANAKTTCYIYAPSPTDVTAYEYVDQVEMNTSVDKSPYFAIQANNQSIYMTGYCPFASTGGDNWSDNGIFEITSFDNKSVHLYLDNLQLYARDKSGEYKIKTREAFQALLTPSAEDETIGEGSMQGSGAAIVFHANTNGNLLSTIHLRGSNVLKGAQGTTLRLDATINGYSFTGTYSQQSSPLQCLVTGKVSSESANKNKFYHVNLDITDEWHKLYTEESSVDGMERTLGSLELKASIKNQVKDPLVPLIDMGASDNTIVRINGGQITFDNTTALAMGTRSIQRSDNNNQIKNNIYGCYEEKRNKTTQGTLSSIGQVQFNDGTINATSPTLLNCPTQTTVDGGSFNCIIKANNDEVYTSFDNDEENPLKPLAIDVTDYIKEGKVVITDHDAFMDDIYPFANYESEQNKYVSLKNYFTADHQYGLASLVPKNNYVYLMLLQDFENPTINQWAIAGRNVNIYEGSVSAVTEGATNMMELKAEIHCVDQVDTYTDKNGNECSLFGQTYKMLYMEKDAFNYIDSEGDPYDVDELYEVSLSNENETKTYTIKPDPENEQQTISNATQYTIQDKVYMLKPLVAAKWMLFTPPFDVANVYIIESYPEEQLVKDYSEGNPNKIITGQYIKEARKAQAQRTMDLYMAWYGGRESSKDFFESEFLTQWMTYESTRGKDGATPAEGSNYMPIIGKLCNFVGKDNSLYPDGMKWWNANYYIYKSTDDWTFDQTAANFGTKWALVETLPDQTDTDGKQLPIMEVGETYAIEFPYNVGGHDPNAMWDYWTGKYILIESTEGPHTILGSNFAMVGGATASDGSAFLWGNSTFASCTIPDDYKSNAWVMEKCSISSGDIDLGDGKTATVTKYESKFVSAKEQAQLELLPTENFLFANFQAPAQMRARSINYKSGEVEYEKIDDNNTGDIETGLPTIMGDLTLIVEPTSEGLTITPIKEQHVMLFDANGKMIFSKHLSAEENVTLPTGVYVVRGEYEQVKAIKK